QRAAPTVPRNLSQYDQTDDDTQLPSDTLPGVIHWVESGGRRCWGRQKGGPKPAPLKLQLRGSIQSSISSADEIPEVRGTDLEPWEDEARVRGAHVPHGHLGKDVAEIRSKRQIASLV